MSAGVQAIVELQVEVLNRAQVGRRWIIYAYMWIQGLQS